MRSETKIYVVSMSVIVFVIFSIVFILWGTNRPVPIRTILGIFALTIIIGGILIYLSLLSKERESSKLMKAEEDFKKEWREKKHEELITKTGEGETFEDKVFGDVYYGWRFVKDSGDSVGLLLIGIIKEGRPGIFRFYDTPDDPALIRDVFHKVKEEIKEAKTIVSAEKEKGKQFAVPTISIEKGKEEGEDWQKK